MGNDRQVQTLLGKGLIRDALETAKAGFKKSPSPESRADLIAAFLARIDQLLRRGEREAAEMTRRVLTERFPESREQVALLVQRAAEGGRSPLERALVRLLDEEKDPTLPRFAARQIARELVDPEEIAGSPLLPPDHPLKRQAAILGGAWGAVTRGEELGPRLEELKAVGRDSPLISWRRAVMAISAFHRGEDGEMLRHLAHIAPEEPVAVVVAALEDLRGGTPFPLNSPGEGAFRALKKRIAGPGGSLRAGIEEFLRRGGEHVTKKTIAAWADLLKRVREAAEPVFPTIARMMAAKACESEHPIQALRLVDTFEALGIPFHRLCIWLASTDRTLDPGGGAYNLCILVLNRPEGKRFSGPQKGWILARAGMLLDRGGEGGVILDDGRELSIAGLYRKALEFWPRAPVRALILEEMELDGASPREVQAEAKKWHEDEPEKLQPLLFLIREARKRRTLQKALGFLEKAEGIDPLHPEIRSARQEILFQKILDGVSKKPTGKSPKEITAFAALLPARDARRVAAWMLWEALRFRTGQAEPNPFPADRPIHPVVETIVGWFGRTVAGSGEDLVLPEVLPDPPLFFKSLAGACAGFHPFGLTIPIGPRISGLVEPHLQAGEIAPEDLLTLCEAFWMNRFWSLLFLASGRGLKLEGGDSHRFLFYRGQSLKETDPPRALDIQWAAEALARRSNDLDFVHRRPPGRKGPDPSPEEFMEKFMEIAASHRGKGDSHGPDPEEIRKIIRKEAAAVWRSPPSRRPREFGRTPDLPGL